MSFKTWLRVGVTGVLSLALSDHRRGPRAGGTAMATTNTTATMMITGAMDAHGPATITAIPIMTATRYAAGTYSLLKSPPGLAKRDRLPPGLERQLWFVELCRRVFRRRCSPARQSWKRCFHLRLRITRTS